MCFPYKINKNKASIFKQRANSISYVLLYKDICAISLFSCNGQNNTLHGMKIVD